ncbi:MAG: hypothetical protein AAGA48_02475 [Myxococcota bacterium]
MEFRTVRCHEAGHPEVRFEVRNPLPVPDIERMVLRYFEEGVAAGTTFEPGQTVVIGSLLGRLHADGDGTLVLRALEADGWAEDIGPGLMRMWRQLEVARSVGLLPDFSHPATTVLVCNRVDRDLELYFMQRNERQQPQESGWYIVCGEEDHDHEDASQFEFRSRAAIIASQPFLDEFLGLPPGADVIVQVARREAGEAHCVGQVFVEGEPREPEPDSYLAARNRAAMEESPIDR